MTSRLKSEGYWVRGVDQKAHEFRDSEADEFAVGDLRRQDFVAQVFDRQFDEVYQFAAEMGGAGYIFTGDHDAHVMRSSAAINLNVIDRAVATGTRDVFFSSSACIYPRHNQLDPDNPMCVEDSAYPADPDSEYGWEKLFSERLYLSCNRQYGMRCRVARYHNIFGPYGQWRGGREKAPAAICRKVAEAGAGGRVEIWGDGQQTRSFLYVDECIEATRRMMRSDFEGPVNIGSDEMVTINQLAHMAAEIAGRRIVLDHVPGPEGVRGRNSDNALIARRLGWAPSASLRAGMEQTYAWIAGQVAGQVSGQDAR